MATLSFEEIENFLSEKVVQDKQPEKPPFDEAQILESLKETPTAEHQPEVKKRGRGRPKKSDTQQQQQQQNNVAQVNTISIDSVERYTILSPEICVFVLDNGVSKIAAKVLKKDAEDLKLDKNDIKIINPILKRICDKYEFGTGNELLDLAITLGFIYSMK